MEELSIEKKAKAYDEAIERAKKWCNAPNADKLPTYVSRVVNEIFPELRESDDERVRNEIIAFVEQAIHRGGGTPIPQEQEDRWIAWLEKQDKKECVLKSSNNEDVSKFVQCIEKQARAYDIELPNRSYDIYAFAKDILAWVEKKNEQKQDPCEHCNNKCLNCHNFPCIVKRAFEQGKSVFEVMNEEKIDNANTTEQKDYNNIDPYFGKPIRLTSKHIDKIKLMFNVGDFIVDNCGYVWKIAGIINQFYILEGVEGGESRPTIEFVNQTFHRWTIKDAKDGDILVAKEWKRPFMFKDLSDILHPEYPVAYCGIDVTDHFMVGCGNFWWTNEEVCPAMNEESKILFDKMKEAGYEWDVEKKELRKIEEKPIDTTEPKFKVGDWIVFNGLTLYIKAIVKGYYVTISKGGIPNSYDWNIDRAARLWTIADAKDGDILCSNQIIVLFKQWEDNTSYSFVIAHEGIDISGKLQITNEHWLISNYAHPATKEQRDLLFTKMKKAGYEWDAENKELKKIEQKPTDNEMKELLRTEYEKGRSDAIGEFQKYAWSDKDEEILLKIMFAFKTGVFPSSKECDSFIEFLKSIKDKFSQNKIDTVVRNCIEN